MSGTQGRIPPPMPLPGQRRPMQDGGQSGQQPPQYAQHPAQQGWPPLGQQGAAPQGGPPAPSFPPRFQAPPQQHAQPGHAQPDLGGYPDNGNNLPSRQQAWSPAPPAPFPPLPGQAPQHHANPGQPNAGVQPPPAPHGFGYPNQQPDVRTEPSRRPPDARLPDPSAYDLGSYGLPMSPAMPTPPTGRDARTAPPQLQPQQPHAPNPAQWPPQQYADNGFGRAPGPAAPPQPQLQPPTYQPPFHAPQPGHQTGQQPGYPAGQQGGGYQAGAAPPQDDDDIEVEEPPRRRRRWLIAAALVGSIGIGSGMAYAYKVFLGPKVASTDGKGQVVRASKDPVKVVPADRGGKQFANTDSRVLNNRVPSEGSAAASGGDAGSSGTTDSNGVRRVATVPVGPAVAVPGMMVVGPNSGPSSLPPSMMEPPRTAAPPPPQQPQQRVAVVQPPPAAAPTPPPAPPRQPVVRAPQPAAEPDPVQRTAAVPPKPPATDRPKPIRGYVAVLGFQKSQLDAMKMMADLQQKYEALRDKRLEIVQSDQTSRGLGVIYRVVAGPRGGITPVRDLCNQLQAAGMLKQGCYPLGE